jgi:L-ascorbate metabolism protein UlaG (beta-lactamase superfamily)
MRVRWFGQSAFRLQAGGRTVFIDPFGVVPPGTGRAGLRFDLPPISGERADLLLITHEHFDHNAAERIGGSPHVVRSTAGTLETPLGTVIAIASEHDDVAGTRRGPNTIFVGTLEGERFCHFGDFGQRELRPEQAAAIGPVDVLFLPVAGGPTIGAAAAAEIVARLRPRLVVPMHYRIPGLEFLPADAEGFLATAAHVRRLRGPEFDTADLRGQPEGCAAVPAPPAP